MKKLFSVLLIGFCTISALAEVSFTFEVGSDIVSAYLWRGQYNGGLSIQPSISVGFESEHTSLDVGVWGSVGASDWGFRRTIDEQEAAQLGVQPQAGTYFNPEIDFTASFSFFGIYLGFSHYYYCDGGNFFGWKKANQWESIDWSSSNTELTLGYHFTEFLDDNHNLYVNWSTMIAGYDFKSIDPIKDMLQLNSLKQNYSSYLEVGYEYTIEKAGLTLGAQVGMVPWTSDYYGTEGFAIKCAALKIDKEFDLGACSLNIWAQGMLDCYNLVTDKNNPEYNLFIKASGEDKVGLQKLNGCIGLGIWF